MVWHMLGTVALTIESDVMKDSNLPSAWKKYILILNLMRYNCMKPHSLLHEIFEKENEENPSWADLFQLHSHSVGGGGGEESKRSKFWKKEN